MKAAELAKLSHAAMLDSREAANVQVHALLAADWGF